MRLRIALLSGTVAMLLAVPATTVAEAAPGAPVVPPRAGLWNILASYGGEIREKTPRADGYRHVDTPATLERLAGLHVDTFLYLIWDFPSDWDDLRREFLPQAQAQGLNVWVYLVPPSECTPQRCSHPYKTDYLKWAEEIAKLSLRYPALRGYAIDDFSHNLRYFTPDYVRRMQKIGKGINPGLVFVPQVYHPAITDQFADAYGPLIDGLIMAYRDDPYRNTQRTDTLQRQIDTASAKLARHGKPLFLMNYTSTLSRTPMPPTPQYVRKTTAGGARNVAQGKLGGTITYNLLLDPTTDWYNKNRAHAGVGRLSLFVPAGVPTSAGGYGAASQTVTVDPGASKYRISFWHNDTCCEGNRITGYHFKQLLVDGKVVWEQDVAADPLGYRQVTVDLTKHLRGEEEATLTFRLYDKRGVRSFWVDVWVDDVKAVGFTVDDPSFETPGSWSASASGRGFLVDFDIYHPDRAIQAYQQVQDVYGGYRLLLLAAHLADVSEKWKALAVLAGDVVRADERGWEPGARDAAAALAWRAGTLGLPRLAGLAQAVAGER
ncbi:hypothetical protein TH66_06330 [Carbonactinospora thermoautotrophica]|uniref:Uncharacterized protein n=2 Tax=Carbonactinospora thermoautotrophica TaxID=1469144 RepID=A0A132N3R5_9ACTN|nr:hypothetical protein [Carbonactinospora thermoautotrophica]KWX04781.1 hypothetical protein TH66_06330 [Carbonactinospora thermoautotrophica]